MATAFTIPAAATRHCRRRPGPVEGSAPVSPWKAAGRLWNATTTWRRHLAHRHPAHESGVAARVATTENNTEEAGDTAGSPEAVDTVVYESPRWSGPTTCLLTVLPYGASCQRCQPRTQRALSPHCRSNKSQSSTSPSRTGIFTLRPQCHGHTTTATRAPQPCS